MPQVYRNKILKLNEEMVAEMRSDALEKILEQITVDGRFDTQGFWKIRKAMKRKSPMCTSVIDEKGREVYGEEGIRKVFEEEFKNRLQPREIDVGYENIKLKTEMLCELVLEKCRLQKEGLFSSEEYV